MYDGIVFRQDLYTPPGCYAIMRDGQLAHIGKMETLAVHYRPGDTIIVSKDTYESLRAHFAKDVTPAGRLALQEAGHG